MTYAMLAEVNTFHEQRVKDVKSSHQHFLQEQIKFYQKVTTVAARLVGYLVDFSFDGLSVDIGFNIMTSYR